MLPDRKVIKDLFEGLLGREVSVSDGKPVDLGIPKPVVASYIDDGHRLRAVVLMDLPLAARSGAAIALVPKGAADDSVDNQLLAPNLFDNASEICNVMAAGLGDAMEVHLRLSMSYAPSDPLPPQVFNTANQAGGREDLKLEIAGYGAGGLSMIVAF